MKKTSLPVVINMSGPNTDHKVGLSVYNKQLNVSWFRNTFVLV